MSEASSNGSSVPKPSPPKPLCYDKHESPKLRTHFCTKGETHGLNHLCPCGARWGSGT